MSDALPKTEVTDAGLFDPAEILVALRRGWWIILIAGIVFTAGATAIAFMVTPIYRGEVTMVAAEDPGAGALPGVLGSLGGMAALAGINLGGKNDVEVSLAVLRSQRFLSQFIRENDLLREFYADEWDPKTNNWKVPAEAPTLMDGLRLMDRSIMSVNRDRRTGIITLGVEWRDRQKAAAWANLLVKRVNEVMRQQAIDEAHQSIDFLNKELAKTTVVDLQQAIYHITETQINRIMMANVRDEYAFKVLDPATVPDAKYKIRPKRLIYVILGAFAGGFTGVAFALWRHFRGRRRITGMSGVAH